MTITLRQESDPRASTKGTSLTFQELDNNFIDVLNRTEFTVEGDSGNAQLSSAATADRRLVINGAGGLTTAVTSDSTGQAVLTLTQGAASIDIANSIVAGDNITITQPDSTGAVTISAAVLDTQVVGGTDITISQPDSAGAFTVSYSGSAISNVVEDTTPQLGGALDCQGVVVSNPIFKDYAETIHSLGSTDTPTITIANGNVQSVTISSGLTLPAFSDAATGQSVTLIVSGSGTASGTANHKFAGGNTTLTTLSVVSIFYDGTNYYTSIATDFQ